MKTCSPTTTVECARQGRGRVPYDGDSVIVDVSSVMQFLLELGVTLARPIKVVSDGEVASI